VIETIGVETTTLVVIETIVIEIETIVVETTILVVTEIEVIEMVEIEVDLVVETEVDLAVETEVDLAVETRVDLAVETEVDLVVTRIDSMTESQIILFHQEIAIASSCLRDFPYLQCPIQKPHSLQGVSNSETLSAAMSQRCLQHSKIPICSIHLCTSVDHSWSTVLIRLPNRKVLFDSFVKRKLRLPKPSGLSCEVSYLFNRFTCLFIRK